MKLLVDTNILLRQANISDEQHKITIEALLRLRSQKTRLYLVPQVLYEFWVVATRPISNNGLGYFPNEVDATVTDYLNAFTFLHDETQLFSRWRRLVLTHGVSGKPAHDARLVAAMQAHSCDGILTFNPVDFQRYRPTITVLTPAEVVA